MKRIVILGAGPAGLSLAWQLLRKHRARFDVVVVEQQRRVGGLSRSFRRHRLNFDLGSHRIHPAAGSETLGRLGDLLGEELAERPRRGRIHIGGRSLRFPLALPDSLFHLPPSLSAGIAADTLRTRLSQKTAPIDSFADLLLRQMGPTLCRAFYFPYAEKLWGLPPDRISADQAVRRIGRRTAPQVIRRMIRSSILHGRRKAHRYFYPRHGFGRVCDAMAEEVIRLGGKVLLDSKVSKIRERDSGPDCRIIEMAAGAGGREPVEADHVFSTIPVPDLIGALRPPPAESVRLGASALRYRAMVLYYVVLETERFSPCETHYFPDGDIFFSRISEPKNYSGATAPRGITGLCVEIPCWTSDPIWDAPCEAIGEKVQQDMRRCGAPVTASILDAFTRRIAHAYPVYDLDYRSSLRHVRRYLRQLPHFVCLGRQGLFIHDNIHHAFDMGFSAARCFTADGRWDAGKWHHHAGRFREFTVED
jgi:protoporphyrinogen oxidase